MFQKVDILFKFDQKKSKFIDYFPLFVKNINYLVNDFFSCNCINLDKSVILCIIFKKKFEIFIFYFYFLNFLKEQKINYVLSSFSNIFFSNFKRYFLNYCWEKSTIKIFLIFV